MKQKMTAMDVRALVIHIVNEMLWVPPLMAGQTTADVGDRFDGDVLGAESILAVIEQMPNICNILYMVYSVAICKQYSAE